MVTISMPPSNIDPVVYNYLYQLAEFLSLQTWSNTPYESAAAVERKGITDNKSMLETEYDAIRSLIIKTADTIKVKESIDGLLKSVKSLSTTLSRDYVAISDFGKYVENLNASISMSPEGIEQYYKFFSELQANLDAVNASFQDYRINTEGYIRTGIVYYDNGVPVFGVAVGQNLATTEIDGETVVEQKNFRATYTASKLSFWQDSTEVAYVSNNQLYISNITSLGKVTIGKWDVDPTDGLAFKWIGG